MTFLSMYHKLPIQKHAYPLGKRNQWVAIWKPLIRSHTKLSCHLVYGWNKTYISLFLLSGNKVIHLMDFVRNKLLNIVLLDLIKFCGLLKGLVILMTWEQSCDESLELPTGICQHTLLIYSIIINSNRVRDDQYNGNFLLDLLMRVTSKKSLDNRIENGLKKKFPFFLVEISIFSDIFSSVTFFFPCHCQNANFLSLPVKIFHHTNTLVWLLLGMKKKLIPVFYSFITDAFYLSTSIIWQVRIYWFFLMTNMF